MAHFTKLDDAAMESLVAEFSLGSLRSWKSIAAGTINSNFRVETDQASFFLRVNEGKGLPEVSQEISVLTHLVARGITTPLPRQAQSGERFALWQGKYVSVFDWLPGTHVDSQSIRDEHCHSVGRALAALHHAGEGMDLNSVSEGRYSYEKIAELFRSFAESDEPTLQQGNPILRDEFAWIDSHVAERDQDHSFLIHADLFPDNVLIEEGEVVALLDFEQACVGSRVYDLAVMINAWCFAEALVPSRLRAMLSGYHSQRPLRAAELAALPIELRVAALRFTVTRITDIHLPGLGAEPSGKDFRRFLMRLETWRRLDSEAWLEIADLAQPGSEC